MAAGLLIIRVVVGLTLAAHGVHKLFGWFGGAGISSTAKEFAGLAYRPSMVFAVLSGVAEAGGGLLLALGLLVPLATAAVVGGTLSALLAVHLKNGFWVYKQGIEYPLVLAVVAAGLAFTGGGAWSLDALLGLNLGGAIWGSVVVVVGAVAALATELYRRRGLAASQRVSEVSDEAPRRAA